MTQTVCYWQKDKHVDQGTKYEAQRQTHINIVNITLDKNPKAI